MVPRMTTWVAIRWVHLLAMAFFVGGQLMLAAVVVPAARDDRPRMRSIARRFGWGTLAATGVLVATGIPLASHFSQWGNGTLHVKLALVGLVAVLIGWHLQRPEWRALDGAIFLGSLAIAWLGVSLAH